LKKVKYVSERKIAGALFKETVLLKGVAHDAESVLTAPKDGLSEKFPVTF